MKLIRLKPNDLNDLNHLESRCTVRVLDRTSGLIEVDDNCACITEEGILILMRQDAFSNVLVLEPEEYVVLAQH